MALKPFTRRLEFSTNVGAHSPVVNVLDALCEEAKDDLSDDNSNDENSALMARVEFIYETAFHQLLQERKSLTCLDRPYIYLR